MLDKILTRLHRVPVLGACIEFAWFFAIGLFWLWVVLLVWSGQLGPSG